MMVDETLKRELMEQRARMVDSEPLGSQANSDAVREAERILSEPHNIPMKPERESAVQDLGSEATVQRGKVMESRYRKFRPAVLTALVCNGGVLSFTELIDAIASMISQYLSQTDYEVCESNGRPKWHPKLGSLKKNLIKDGLLEDAPRNTWRISELGRQEVEAWLDVIDKATAPGES